MAPATMGDNSPVTTATMASSTRARPMHRALVDKGAALQVPREGDQVGVTGAIRRSRLRAAAARPAA